jgi:hypothetical protein
MSIRVDEQWHERPKGSENRSSVRAAPQPLSARAFTPEAAGIAEWFARHPAE